jgi:curved DNA-binding protein CbpA
MTATNVVDLALACYRTPLAYQDWLSRAAPLPEGIDRLLWLANGSPEVLEAAARQTGAQPGELRDAARFCIQQWCLVRGADPHRVLGVEPGAPPEQIKEHYRLLMRLFHPDRAAGRETWTDHYASRINEAWTALSRTPDRAMPDRRPAPRDIRVRDTVRPVAKRAVDRSGPLSSRHPPGRRLRRQWLPRLAWGGLTLTVMMVLGGFYLEHFFTSRSGFEPTGAMNSTPFSGAAPVPESAAAPVAGLRALDPFLAAPDWQALEQHESLARLEEQVTSAPARAERLAVEQQRWVRLQAEQARVKQAKTERELAEQRRLRALQAEQQRLEQLQIEQARKEPARREKRVTSRAPPAPVVVAPAEERPLTLGELESLMSRYTRAYQRGDLNGVMALFTAGARRRIEQDYTALFATHHIRGLWLRDLRWLYRDRSASGSGRYELQVQRRDNGEPHQVGGSIRFTVQKRGHQVLIEAIEFDWPGN